MPPVVADKLIEDDLNLNQIRLDELPNDDPQAAIHDSFAHVIYRLSKVWLLVDPMLLPYQGRWWFKQPLDLISYLGSIGKRKLD
jgi:hypothetical protein